MKLFKILTITITLLFCCQNTFSQTVSRANRLFDRLSYKKAVKVYTNVYEKGNSSYEVISRIADCYYFNTKTKKAVEWYTLLSNKFSNKLKEEHVFRYAQSLKANKKYKEADVAIKQIAAIHKQNNLVKQLLSNPEYYLKYKHHKYEIIDFYNLSMNTKYSDFGAYVFKNELYFTSANTGAYKRLYQWNEQPYLNLYKGVIQDSLKGTLKEKIDVKKVVLLPPPVRTKFHESNAIFTKDGKTMYFTRDNYYKGKKRRNSKERLLLKLYKALLINGEWGGIIELPFNNDEYSIGHPALSPDEKTLYFVSDMPGGFGATDIYKVSVSNNSYGTPINLGKEINTSKKEMFPYVSKDNTLYFSSEGHLGLGGLDIFESPITDGKFGKLENLQHPFNSNLDDFCFYIDSENIKGFISSNRKNGKGDDDIYSFLLKHSKRRLDYNCNKVIVGVVTDLNTSEILSNASVKIYDEEGKLIKEIQSDEKGAFSFSINCISETYKLKGAKTSYTEDIEEVVTSELKDNNIIKLELSPIEKIIPPTETVTQTDYVNTIHPIYFNFNKSTIRKGDSKPELEGIITIMKQHKDLVIKIESHTDSRGNYKYNRRLSNRRAQSTRQYIISKGIPAVRIFSAKGYGETQLLNNCDNKTKCTEEQHQLNRRSYFVIVKGGKGVNVENTPPKIIGRKRRL